MQDHFELIDHFPSTRILCVGDVMLDRFTDGQVKRISPESPVPILSVKKSDLYPGGAANVARNVASLGGHCTLISVVGRDGAAAALTGLLTVNSGISTKFVAVEGRSTSEKTRFVALGQHMLRTDIEDTSWISAEIEDALLAVVAREIPEHHAVILSDYAKGVLTDRVIAETVKLSLAASVAVAVDPKSNSFARYNGATIVTPNTKETRDACGIDSTTDEDAIAAGHMLLSTTTIGSILVTRADKGMTLVSRDTEPVHIPATVHEVTDVVGAGDTVVAALSLALGVGARPVQAARLANAAAGVVVTKRGTATLSRDELKAALNGAGRNGHSPSSAKVLTVAEAVERTRSWQREGLKVGFTNGCFDIVHVGHVAILDFSRANCDRLIVALNTDASVQRLKGPTRPINSQDDRARLIAALGMVDGVVLFEEDTPKELITLLGPDVLVKGADYTVEQIVGADQVLARGGKVLRFELLPGRSTTSIVAQAKSAPNSAPAHKTMGGSAIAVQL